MRGGISALTLPAGYLGSSLIGALLIFCGFDIVASKVASIVLGVCFLLTLWWGKRDWLTIGTILLAVALIVAFWFIEHAEPLRFVVLFIGVMSALYSVWDIVRLPFLSPPYPIPSFQGKGSTANRKPSATILSSEKSTRPMPAYSLNDTAALHSAGVCCGLLSRLYSWLAPLLLGLLRFRRRLLSRRLIRRSSFRLCELRRMDTTGSKLVLRRI